jgi:acyl carrier protein
VRSRRQVAAGTFRRRRGVDGYAHWPIVGSTRWSIFSAFVDRRRPPMTNDPSLRSQLRTFLARNFLLSDEPFPYGDEVSLLAEGVVDSTGVLELILFLEERLGVHVADHEAVPRNLDSVRRILEFVARKRGPVADAG